MASPAHPVRPLGPSEIFSSSRHALGFYKCVANTCRYSVPRAKLGEGTVREAFQTAVANVALAIPSLSVGIADQDTSKPRFVQQSSLDLEHHFEYLERPDVPAESRDSALLAILADQHDRTWPDIERRPPWKLTVVVWDASSDSNTLTLDAVLAAHHAIADGRSTAFFHAQLLDELNRSPSLPAQLNGRVLDTTAVRGLVPPAEELVKFTKSWGFLLATLWRELGPAWGQLSQPAAPWTGKAVTREPCQTRLRLVAVPTAAVPRILAACRAHQTTLTPLLHALCLASLARRVPQEQVQAFRSATPIDLRPFTGGSKPPSFGVFVTTQSHQFDASAIAGMRDESSEDNIWRVAADLRRDMKQHLENMPNDDLMGMLGWVSDWKQFWLGKVGKPRQDTWEVSNIGSMAGGHGSGEQSGATESWTIQRSVMSQGATVAGAAISVNVAGVAGGEVGISLGWQDGIVETETAEGLAHDLQRCLDRLGSGRPLFDE